VIAAAALLALVLPMQQQGAWSELHKSEDLVVWSRHRAGAEVNEMRAVGVVDAPAEVLWALVRDVERHTELLPDTTVSKVLRTEGDVAFVRQRSEPAVLDPREYVIAVRERSETLANGRVRHTLSWKATPRFAGALAKDAVHLSVNEGFWTVEALPGGRARVTFQLLLDPAGFVPPALVNLSQSVGAQQALAVLTAAARRTAT
jgi:Polyketide cyclase / dehydrase and lipid transport